MDGFLGSGGYCVGRGNEIAPVLGCVDSLCFFMVEHPGGTGGGADSDGRGGGSGGDSGGGDDSIVRKISSFG